MPPAAGGDHPPPGPLHGGPVRSPPFPGDRGSIPPVGSRDKAPGGVGPKGQSPAPGRRRPLFGYSSLGRALSWAYEYTGPSTHT